MNKKTTDFLKIVMVYIVAILGGIYSIQNYATESNLITLLQADITATVIVFIGSVWLKNASTYDAYWSVIPIAMIPFWLMTLEGESIPLRAIITALLITIWGIRLTYNWYRGWKDLTHEDWRYINLRKKIGYFYPFVNFLGIHLLPTLMVFAGALSFEHSLTSYQSLNILDFAGITITTIGIYFETQADKELHRFKQRTNPQKEDILTTGIWSWCRHPNYFGEISFWIGMFFLGWGASGSVWPLILGPLCMIALFIGISIPMIDKRMLAKRPHYKEVIKTKPSILPLGLFFQK